MFKCTRLESLTAPLHLRLLRQARCIFSNLERVSLFQIQNSQIACDAVPYPLGTVNCAKHAGPESTPPSTQGSASLTNTWPSLRCPEPHINPISTSVDLVFLCGPNLKYSLSLRRSALCCASGSDLAARTKTFRFPSLLMAN